MTTANSTPTPTPTPGLSYAVRRVGGDPRLYAAAWLHTALQSAGHNVEAHGQKFSSFVALLMGLNPAEIPQEVRGELLERFEREEWGVIAPYRDTLVASWGLLPCGREVGWVFEWAPPSL